MNALVISRKYFLSTLSSVGIKTYILGPCFSSIQNPISKLFHKNQGTWHCGRLNVSQPTGHSGMNLRDNKT